MNKSIEDLKEVLKREEVFVGDKDSIKAINQAIKWVKQLEQIEDQHRAIMNEDYHDDEKHCTCVSGYRTVVAKLRQENEELEKDQKRIIEACGYKKVVELQAQLSRVEVYICKNCYGKGYATKMQVGTAECKDLAKAIVKLKEGDE